MVQPSSSFAAVLAVLIITVGTVAANDVSQSKGRRSLRDSAYAVAYASTSSSGGDSQTWASASGDSGAAAYSSSATGDSTSQPSTGTQPSSDGGSAWPSNNDFPQVFNSFSSNQGDALASPSPGDTSSGFTAQPVPSSGASAGYAQDALDKHNYYRARHGCQALTWSSQLESDAAAWASGCAFQHSGVNGQGENLAWGYDNIAAVIDAFYAEEKIYTYGEPNPSNFEQVGHFTQLVWRATTEVGCAVSQCGSQRYDVCRYSPAGNVYGQYAQEVYPPTNSRHFLY